MTSDEFACPKCRRMLYAADGGEIACPYCGARVAVPTEMARRPGSQNHSETLEERCARLERELEIVRLRAEVEHHAAFERFLNVGGGWFSAAYRQSARDALDSGDLEKARRKYAAAKKAGNIGCIIQVLVLLIVFLTVSYMVK